MKLFSSLAVLCGSVAPALSLLIDFPGSVNHGEKVILTAIGASSSSKVSLRFEAPCQGCFAGSDNGLVFALAIHRATESCGEGRIGVNGQEVEWFGRTDEGAGIFPTLLANGLGTREVNATWKASCIVNEAQVFSFQIHHVGQDIPQGDSGFTISFQQQGQPEVLRLVGEPLDIRSLQDHAGQWTHPDKTHRLTLAPIAAESSQSRLDDELLQLQALEAKSHDVQKVIGEKKHKIHQLLRDDFMQFCSAIKNCDSLRCIFRTTRHKLSEYARIVSAHCIKHRPAVPVKSSSEQDVAFDGPHKQGDDTIFYGGPKDAQDSKVQHDELGQHRAPTASLSHLEHAPSPLAPSQSRDLSSTPSPTPYYSSGHMPAAPSLSSAHYPNGSQPFPHFENHHNSRHHIFQFTVLTLPFLIVLSGLTFLLLRRCNLLCASPRHRVSCLASREEKRNRRAYRRAARRHAWRSWWNRHRRPRSNEDYEEKRMLILEQEGILEDVMQDDIRGLRIAQGIVEDMVQAEEGRSRLYHPAALHQPCATSPLEPAEFGAYPSNSSSLPPPTSLSSSSSSATTSTARTGLQDYQMQLMLLEQQQKRRLMMARQEINRSTAQNELPISNQPNMQPHFLPNCRRSSSASSQSASSSLPPPRYEEELEADINVVDGFLYLPNFGHEYMHSHASEGGDVDDVSPDSSVVDCSPRMSFDTGRTTFTSTAK